MNGMIQIVKIEELDNSTKFVAALNPQKTIEMISKATKTELQVYFLLASYVDKDTGECYPSQKTLADKMGVTISAINQHIKSLEKKGFIRIEKVTRDNDMEKLLVELGKADIEIGDDTYSNNEGTVIVRRLETDDTNKIMMIAKFKK